jgi:hypothetical protein
LHLEDLLGVGARKRSAEHCEILGEDEHHPAVDTAPAGDHAIARDALVGHAELGDPVLDEHVELLERALVEQEVDAFARGELALGVLAGDAPHPAADPRLFAPFLEFCQDVLHAARPSRH